MKDEATKFTEICGSLPDYCRDYFIAKYDTYLPKTKTAYALDLKIFFWYLSSSVLPEKSIRQITLADIDALKVQDIEMFLVFLDKYEMPDADTGEMKIFENKIPGKRRKLAT